MHERVRRAVSPGGAAPAAADGPPRRTPTPPLAPLRPTDLNVVGQGADDDFCSGVATAVGEYVWRVLPQQGAAHVAARRLGKARPLVHSVRFCVEADANGTPLQPEPLRSLELWCLFGGWGLVHVGAVPVPYDRQFRCAFPQIAEAVLHTVPPAASSLGSPGREAEAAAAPRYLVSLTLADERRILHAIEETVSHHVPPPS